MCLQEKIRQAIAEANLAMDVSTDSESVADASGLSDSDGEEQQINLNELRAPLDKGWKRETVIRGLTKNGQIRGDVYYYAPGTQTRLKHIGQIQTVNYRTIDLSAASQVFTINFPQFPFSPDSRSRRIEIVTRQFLLFGKSDCRRFLATGTGSIRNRWRIHSHDRCGCEQTSRRIENVYASDAECGATH